MPAQAARKPPPQQKIRPAPKPNQKGKDDANRLQLLERLARLEQDAATHRRILAKIGHEKTLIVEQLTGPALEANSGGETCGLCGFPAHPGRLC